MTIAYGSIFESPFRSNGGAGVNDSQCMHSHTFGSSTHTDLETLTGRTTATTNKYYGTKMCWESDLPHSSQSEKIVIVPAPNSPNMEEFNETVAKAMAGTYKLTAQT